MATVIMATGLAINVIANFTLIPRLGINGAALSSSISYTTTAIITVAVFRRLSGIPVVDTLVIKRSDLVAMGLVLAGVVRRRRGEVGVPESQVAVDMVLAEHDPGEEA